MRALSPKSLEDEIDQLYHLPLEQFVASRNALALKLSGPQAVKVRELQKPSLSAWAVNQLSWTSPGSLREIEKAVEKLRNATKQAAFSRSDVLRSAAMAYRAAVQSTFRRSLKILESARRPANAKVRDEIVRTLESLPGEEPSGRLTRPPESRGFDLLKGLKLPSGHGAPVPAKRPSTDEAPVDGEMRMRGRGPEPRKRQRVKLDDAHQKTRLRERELETRERTAKQERRRAQSALVRARAQSQGAKSRFRKAAHALEKLRSIEQRTHEELTQVRSRLASQEKTVEEAEAEVRRSGSEVEAAEKALSMSLAQMHPPRSRHS